jgi:nitrite reductase/ring-hydroxylating ferredoxin subunit
VSEWRDVGSLEELDRDGRVVARVAGREVGVVRDPGSEALHGIRNRCPHHGGPLCLGRIEERQGGAPGTYALTGRPILRCPWHGWEFDLETGRCLDDPSLRVAVYAVEVADGRVRVCA